MASAPKAVFCAVAEANLFMKLKNSFLSLTMALAAMGGISSVAHADVILFGNAADAVATGNTATGIGSGITSAGSTQSLTTGYVSGSQPRGRSAVFVFQLPTLTTGQIFTTANLDIAALAKTGAPTFNADLYGLGARASSTVLATDYFSGTLDTTDATSIQDNFITPTTTVGTGGGVAAGVYVSTDNAGDTNLLNYLNGQYNGGAGAGQFVFFRVNGDFIGDPAAGTSTYGFVSSDQSTANNTNDPRLTYNVGTAAVPEPSTIALFSFGLASLGAIRRRKKQAESEDGSELV